MAYDAGLAQVLRDDLAELHPAEVRMFGGIAFMVGGHMVCGVHKGGAMFRVGKQNDAAGRAIPGTAPMMFTHKPMAGFVDADDDCLTDDARRGRLLALALDHVRGLPPK